MKRLALSLVVAVGAYAVGAVAGYVLIAQLSANTHDRSAEAAMTAVLVTGPLAALVAFAVAMVRLRKSPRAVQ